MPQLMPFYFVNQVTFLFLILIIILYVLSKYILPKYISLFSARLSISRL
uniref:ATP synthase protein 8 n=1 Tax=Arthonia susa TaxID=2488734 RepID=A0A3Q9CS57_9PEZI|nr:ATP synthase F0 subunit 8 [Arthonia susa]